MVSKVYICFYPLHNSPQTPLTAKFQGKSKCSSKSKHNNDTWQCISGSASSCMLGTKKKQDCIWTGHTPSLNSVPMIILTGRAETPRVIEINTSKRSPPIRIENATQSGLKHPCYTDDSMLNQSKEHHYMIWLQKWSSKLATIRPYPFTILWSEGWVNTPYQVICLLHESWEN